MKDNYIQLGKSNVLTLKIVDLNGKETGESLVFDLEDLELPLRYQDMLEADKKNKQNLRNQMLVIDKRQDVKGKKLFTKNEEDKYRALNEFFKKEAEIYNMFLGENGVQKLLNGRKLGWFTLDEIDEIIDKQITPYFEKMTENITEKVKQKYGQAVERNKEKLEIDE